MSFDMNIVLGDMTQAAKDAVQDVGEIGRYFSEIMEDKKQSLHELVQARIVNEISQDVFDQEVEREKKVVEAELLAIEIMTKAKVQRAVNAAINVFVDAVKAVV